MNYVNTNKTNCLLKAVKAALIMNDSSLSAWSDNNGVKRQNLTKALSGSWQGPAADRLISKIIEDLDVVLLK